MDRVEEGKRDVCVCVCVCVCVGWRLCAWSRAGHTIH